MYPKTPFRVHKASGRTGHSTPTAHLCIAIENKMEHKDENKKEHYLRREFSYSKYQQTYALPDDVVKEHIAAKVDNGVLTITMPKLTKAEEKQIQRTIDIA